jgi:hypothetical protein
MVEFERRGLGDIGAELWADVVLYAGLSRFQGHGANALRPAPKAATESLSLWTV